VGHEVWELYRRIRCPCTSWEVLCVHGCLLRRALILLAVVLLAGGCLRSGGVAVPRPEPDDWYGGVKLWAPGRTAGGDFSSRTACFVLIPLGVSVWAFAAAPPQWWESLGLALRGERQRPDRDTVVATVNGQPVTAQMVRTAKLMLEAQRSLAGEAGAVSDEEALKYVIRQVVLYQECVRRGVALTDAETDRYVATVRDMLAQAFAKNPQAKAQFDAYLRGLGIDEDEFWRMSREAYRQAGSIARLRAEVYRSVSRPEGMSDAQFLEWRERQFEQLADRLVREATVTRH